MLSSNFSITIMFLTASSKGVRHRGIIFLWPRQKVGLDCVLITDINSMVWQLFVYREPIFLLGLFLIGGLEGSSKSLIFLGFRKFVAFDCKTTCVAWRIPKSRFKLHISLRAKISTLKSWVDSLFTAEILLRFPIEQKTWKGNRITAISI